ncbi:MAG: sugar ABC transporter substrate-binding protein, partial [Lachnospiraceae bacterium]|nr:sugar ABC transporter substrate-binding protein [Lachnospiraceae bacterium]
MKKKLLSVLLASAMVLSLAACDSKTPASSTETSASASTEVSASEEVKADEPDARGLLNGKFVDTREISVELYDRNVDGGTEAGNNAWTKWIQEQMLERYNVKVSFVTVARWTEGDDINNLLAAGTAPDICYTYSYPTIQTYANMGCVLDLAPILEENKDL